ncbi:MAG: glutamate--tRNA ligase [Bacilli bacterium]|nr:glutamate--tRNA ligase [Bacilli bacterium]
MDKNIELANLIFPNITKTVEDYEKMYPERNLPEGAKVTRYAPSPTGFIHIGALLSSFTGDMIARQSNGVFYLRIEDTDTERTIENGINVIIEGLKEFGVDFDEGPLSDGTFKGNYGPYVQSQRKEIYHAFIKHLIIEGKAYPCFCTKEENDAIREHQTAGKKRIGYYGKYAKCRNIPTSEAIERIKNGDKYIIRLKSPGCFDRRIVIDDLIKGRIEMPENDIDIPIMKGDGLPTYHFAHLVDDHLMRTTHITRGDEWIPSLPIHIQLFQMFGFKAPKYAHLSPISKNDNGTVRKISKRKDPEAAMSYYHKEGIPSYAVMLYLATLMNSNFEEWYNQNKDKKYTDFKFDFKKMSKSCPLFDGEKLNNISKTYFSLLKASDIYNDACEYFNKYDKEFYDIFTKDKDYSINLLNIEREVKKPRKDIASYKDIKKEFNYMYDELFDSIESYEWQNITDINDIKEILNTYISMYDINDDKNEWFNKCKELCDKLGYASDMKEYKANPEKYKGNVADVTTVIRVALTKRAQTPDLYELLKLIGVDGIKSRFEKVA